MVTLIIVDFQKDFANKDGALYVNGSENAENAIIKYIDKNFKEISDVVFTVDWHPQNHCSFKKNGGIWPVHCLAYSEGAGISDKIYRKCIEHNISVKVFEKGTAPEREEYGAFEYVDLFENEEHKPVLLACSNIGTKSSVIFNSFNLVVCGIAGDYCVKETIKNLLTNKNANIYVLMDGIASIDDGTTIKTFIEENNLHTV